MTYGGILQSNFRTRFVTRTYNIYVYSFKRVIIKIFSMLEKTVLVTYCSFIIDLKEFEIVYTI